MKKSHKEIIVEDITYKTLVSKNAFYGHSCDIWDPRTAPFIMGTKSSREPKKRGKSNLTYLIDLNYTLKAWRRTKEAIINIASNGGTFLLVGTIPVIKSTKKITNPKTKEKVEALNKSWIEYSELIKECAEIVGCNYVNTRWKGGILTNLPVIKKSINQMLNLKDFLERIESPNPKSTQTIQINKKEKTKLKKDLIKLEYQFGGLASMTKLPDMVIVLNMNENKTAVFEAKKLGIPVTCVGDTIANPEYAEYFIPANDDSLDTLKLFVTNIAACIEIGKKEYLEKEQLARQILDENEDKELDDALQVSITATDIPVEYKNSNRSSTSNL